MSREKLDLPLVLGWLAMKTSDANAGKSISVILVLMGVVIVFTAELLWLSLVGGLLMAVGLWELIN